MEKIDVEIKGICPLLQNQFNTKEQGAEKSRAKKKNYVPEEEAEKGTYRNEKNEIYEPAEHILGSLIRSAVNFKFEGKKSFKDIVRSAVFINPVEIPLLNDKGKPFKTWSEIDVRPVVIQRARVVKWRPKFNNWAMAFDIQIMEEDLLNARTLKEILEFAGQRQGIGDYRPRFGRFQVTSWQVQNG